MTPNIQSENNCNKKFCGITLRVDINDVTYNEISIDIAEHYSDYDITSNVISAKNTAKSSAISLENNVLKYVFNHQLGSWDNYGAFDKLLLEVTNVKTNEKVESTILIIKNRSLIDAGNLNDIKIRLHEPVPEKIRVNLNDYPLLLQGNVQATSFQENHFVEVVNENSFLENSIYFIPNQDDDQWKGGFSSHINYSVQQEFEDSISSGSIQMDVVSGFYAKDLLVEFVEIPEYIEVDAIAANSPFNSLLLSVFNAPNELVNALRILNDNTIQVHLNQVSEMWGAENAIVRLQYEIKNVDSQEISIGNLILRKHVGIPEGIGYWILENDFEVN